MGDRFFLKQMAYFYRDQNCKVAQLAGLPRRATLPDGEYVLFCLPLTTNIRGLTCMHWVVQESCSAGVVAEIKACIAGQRDDGQIDFRKD